MKRNVLLILMSILASLMLCSCNDEYTITLASGRYISSDCPLESAIPGVTLYYLYKKDGSDKWMCLYSGIENFTFEQGYEVVMKVEEIHISNPPEDGFSKIRRAKKIYSKEKKDSDVGTKCREVLWDPENQKYYYKE